MLHISFTDAENAGRMPANGLQRVLAEQCPICKTKRAPLRMSILHEREYGQTVSLQCQECRSHMLAVLAQPRSGMPSFGFTTDVQPEEMDTFLRAQPVSIDDVLNLIQQLEKDV